MFEMKLGDKITVRVEPKISNKFGQLGNSLIKAGHRKEKVDLIEFKPDGGIKVNLFFNNPFDIF